MNKGEYIKAVGNDTAKALLNNLPLWQKSLAIQDLINIYPVNPLNDKIYNGINTINLLAQQIKFSSNRWITYAQAQNAGGQVRAGEKATIIEVWKTNEIVDALDTNGNPKIDSNGNIEKIAIKLEYPKQTFVAVFNTDQIDHLPYFINTIPSNGSQIIKNLLKNLQYNIVDKEALAILKTTNSNTVLNAIVDKTYRERYNVISSPQGSFQYAKDKLIHNFAVLGLCRQYGIDFYPTESTNVLLKQWIKIATDNPIEIFKSASVGANLINLINKQVVNVNIKNVEEATKVENVKNIISNITYDNSNYLAEFKKVAEDLGLIIDEPIADGKLHRVSTIGDKIGEKTGAYVLYSDGRPAGYIQNFRGEKITWKASTSFQPPPKEQKAAFATMVAEKKRLMEAEKKAIYEKVANKVTIEFQSSIEAEEHPYLEKKGVKSYGLKIDKYGNLMMPMYDINGKQWSIERINIDFKGFERNSKLQGNFFIIGTIKPGNSILITEGYATAATLYEVTKMPCVVTASSNNMINVAKVLNTKYPNNNLIIIGDNDYAKQQIRKANGVKNAQNKGVEEAKKAAWAVKVIYAYPFLNRDEIAKGYSDFNDLCKSRGVAEVTKQINIAIEKSKTYKQQSYTKNIDSKTPNIALK
ncbi:MAG: ssDNA-binding domain-containing protein [Endomicrobium sp.]|jgi:phage/plasmid primase-like uncharacterized protein/antirestriction protein ArdC|nr:ssDNA-binding domain-containing protein [Endomicrobium sp.]